LRAHRAVTLLPEEVHKEDEDEVIVGADQTAEQRDVLSKLIVTMMARHNMSIL
jgi:hypothetical protein